MNELISIIVPVYKVEQYLDKCIQSIVDQTYTNLEIILVDDGSPDRCPEMCDTWVMRDSRIRVIHQQNGGLAAVRNAGLDAVTGEFICFVDSDDAIVPILCEKIIEAFSRYDVDIVAFNCQRITEVGELLGGTETLTTGILTKEEALSELICGKINDYLWSKVYKRSLFDNLRFVRQRACFEDIDITHHLILRAERIYCLDEPLYFYYQRSNSVSAAMTAAKLCDLYQVRAERYKLLQIYYPHLAEKAIPRLAVSALNLYDRSLWEAADETIVAEARCFLKENRKAIMTVNGTIGMRMYYFVPGIYRCLRLTKHILGNLFRCLGK